MIERRLLELKSRNYKKKNRDRINLKQRRYYLKNRKKINKLRRLKRKEAKYNAQQKAREMTRWLIEKGELVLSDKCAFCSSKRNLVKHHSNYKNPKDVTVMCRKCHSRLHSFDFIKDKKLNIKKCL